MNNGLVEPLDRSKAAEYASWFKALADTTRVQIVSLLARRGEPMSVGEITAAVEVGQSTVSAHLKVLAEVRFVLSERHGTSAYYRINQACVACFPTAADIVMGSIEDVSLPDGHVDVVISNCVINLSADKPRVLAEAFRVLRPGGRLAVSDIIAVEDLAPQRRAAAERRAGGTTGTVTAAGYRQQLLEAGFTQITITPATDAGSGLHSAIVQAVRPAAPPGVVIRPMRAADACQVLAIYQAGLDTGQASLETAAPGWDAFDAARLPLHRHVAVDAATGQVVGWVAATAVSSRCVYAGVIEHSVYVDPARRRRGIAAALLDALTGSAEAAGVWTIQTGIFPENTASLRLHAQAGFRVVGTRERIGRHYGRWRDVVLLERRSRTVGTG